MNRRRDCRLVAAVLAATLGWSAAPGVFAQERAPSAKAETPVWITLATSDLVQLRQTKDAAGWADWFEQVEAHDGISLVQIKEGQLEPLAQAMHRRFHRCGGFLAFDNIAGALEHLYVQRPADPDALFVTYTIDNAAVANAMIAEVQATNIVSTINLLAGNTTRYYTNSGGVNAANQLKARWDTYAAGRSDVSVALYTHPGWAQPSVIATITGTTLPNEIVVIGGHLDSINSSSPSSGTAPGADDDASGVATLTEAFRAAMALGFRPQRTVKFMAYAAEEVGLRGSGEIALAHKNAAANVVGVLQLDMTNYKGSTQDMAWLTDFTNAAQTTFLRDLLNTYLPAVTHTTTACGYACSDHASWHNQGFPASMPSEAIFGQHNSRIHTANDTLANSDPAAGHAIKFARLAVTYLAELAKGGFGTPAPGFGVSCSPSSLSIAKGATGNTTCTVSSSGGFNSAVSLGCSGLPSGVTCSYSPASVTPPANGSATSTLTLTVSASAAAGASTVQAQGTNGSTTNSSAIALTVTNPAGVLSNGVPVTGLAGATGSNTYFTMVVPAGATNLRFVTSGGSGDLDLYARFGSQPTTTVRDCASESGTNAETCTIATASAGTYHVLVYGFAAYSGATLTGSFTAPGGPSTVIFYSVASEDGRLFETSETANTGGGGNSTDNTTSSLRVGDFSDDTQYRDILSFDTSPIPDGATITSATLRIKRGSLTGTSPFSTHGLCTVDIHSTGFGGAVAFANGDFQAAATASGVTTMSNPTSNGTFSTGALNAAGIAAVNKTGKTQVRVYFTLDDNDDNGSDYIGFYSGEAASGNRPELVITYQ
jgi:leucyl aminopeptidase